MTTLQQLSRAGQSQLASAEAPKKPSIGKEVQRLAAQLRTAASGGPQLLMITPASHSQSVFRLAYETALALVQVNESPVLVIDLEPNPSEAVAVSAGVARSIVADAGGPAAPERAASLEPTPGMPTLAVIRPLDNVDDPVSYLSSPKFARVLEDSRKSFAHTVIAAGCVMDSVGALVVSSACDGVVLHVKEDECTATMLREINRVLARNRAKLLGFLYETR